ncbi:hypothetical protein ACMX2H_16005 [Arthrobacter sulfonylureivorans]|uniref:hypothetical protein n=1 Tax=Arthrobacter sulfonylureivorans TaxID=2486855 RepID=UPI0039E38322
MAEAAREQKRGKRLLTREEVEPYISGQCTECGVDYVSSHISRKLPGGVLPEGVVRYGAHGLCRPDYLATRPNKSKEYEENRKAKRREASKPLIPQSETLGSVRHSLEHTKRGLDSFMAARAARAARERRAAIIAAGGNPLAQRQKVNA